MAEDLSKQVKIRVATYDRLTERGRKNETYDAIINRALDAEDRMIISDNKAPDRDKGKARKGKRDNVNPDD